MFELVGEIIIDYSKKLRVRNQYYTNKVCSCLCFYSNEIDILKSGSLKTL